MTAGVYGLQHELVKLSWKSSFPIKDPGHYADINIVVGEEQEKYNSFIHAKLRKKAHKANFGTLLLIQVKKCQRLSES